MKKSGYKEFSRSKIIMLTAVLGIITSLCGCAANAEAEETMQSQPQDDSLQDDSSQDEEAEIDEELKRELISQLLNDKNKDTSVLKNSKVTKGCEFTLPEDFEKSPDIEGLYVNEHYPVDASVIFYVEKDEDLSIQLMSEKFFIKNMSEELKQTYGKDVEIELKEFEELTIDGYPSFRILFNYTIDEVEITQLEYIINADKSYVITYSQTDEYDRMEEFEESAATIQVKF